MRFNYMICPARDLGANAFSNVTCKPNPVFVWRELPIAAPIQHLLENTVSHHKAHSSAQLNPSLVYQYLPYTTLHSRSTLWLWPRSPR
jgi:hypothetical protein